MTFVRIAAPRRRPHGRGAKTANSKTARPEIRGGRFLFVSALAHGRTMTPLGQTSTH